MPYGFTPEKKTLPPNYIELLTDPAADPQSLKLIFTIADERGALPAAVAALKNPNYPFSHEQLKLLFKSNRGLQYATAVAENPSFELSMIMDPRLIDAIRPELRRFTDITRSPALLGLIAALSDGDRDLQASLVENPNLAPNTAAELRKRLGTV
jgi:hypothetical protein